MFLFGLTCFYLFWFVLTTTRYTICLSMLSSAVLPGDHELCWHGWKLSWPQWIRRSWWIRWSTSDMLWGNCRWHLSPLCHVLVSVNCLHHAPVYVDVVCDIIAHMNWLCLNFVLRVFLYLLQHWWHLSPLCHVLVSYDDLYHTRVRVDIEHDINAHTNSLYELIIFDVA